MSPWRLPRSRRWAARGLTKANIAAPECPHGPFRRKMSRLLVAEEMQDREIEHLRVLQEGEMAHVRQDEETGMRDGRRDIFGVLALDRLVMVAVDDQDGRVDRRELSVRPIRLVPPHLADLIDEGGIFLGRR